MLLPVAREILEKRPYVSEHYKTAAGPDGGEGGGAAHGDDLEAREGLKEGITTAATFAPTNTAMAKTRSRLLAIPLVNVTSIGEPTA